MPAGRMRISATGTGCSQPYPKCDEPSVPSVPVPWVLGRKRLVILGNSEAVVAAAQSVRGPGALCAIDERGTGELTGEARRLRSKQLTYLSENWLSNNALETYVAPLRKDSHRYSSIVVEHVRPYHPVPYLVHTCFAERQMEESLITEGGRRMLQRRLRYHTLGGGDLASNFYATVRHLAHP